MTQLVFSDAHFWKNFLPLSFTRPVAEMRCGILSFSERWKKLLNLSEVSYSTEDYLQEKYPKPKPEVSLVVVPNFIPNNELLLKIKNLELGEALVYENELLAVKINMHNFSLKNIHKMTDIYDNELTIYRSHTDLFSKNKLAIDFDFELLTKGKTSQNLSTTNRLVGDLSELFIEEGATLECAILNTKTGKIYIGKNAEVKENCALRGPIALCEGASFNMGAKVYGPTTIGPYAKMGGEINSVVVFGYSNKAHDGYLGNSVIGEWCNIGADTSSSNLKINYSNIKLWNYETMSFINSGLQFVGVIMGDHVKTAINVQLNTGTLVGVAANIFKTGFPPCHIESFSWGGMKNDPKIKFESAIEISEQMMKRRNVPCTEEDKKILHYLYEQSENL